MDAKSLRAAEVWRGGVTARSVSEETQNVELTSKDRAMRFVFHMSSKGGGTSVVYLEIGGPDFLALVETMVQVDRQAAMAAMSEELAKQITMQPTCDVANLAEGRNSVKQAAQKKYLAAPTGSDDAERFLFESVKKLVSDLEKGEKAGKSISVGQGKASVTQMH